MADAGCWTGSTWVLREGEILCLIGHNGAGKSTLMKLLFGLQTPTSGEIRLRGVRLQPRPAVMARQGVAYVPEGRGVFPGLTVAEIFTLAAWSAGLKAGDVAERTDEVMGVLPLLRSFWTRRAGQLSGGQQQMVSIGRALLSRPSILLMDEPSVGLAPKLFQDLLAPVRALRQARGLSILLGGAKRARGICHLDRVVVMKSGHMIFDGPPAELADHGRLMALF